MSRVGCEGGGRDRTQAGQTWSAGWRLRYRLPAEHVLTPWIVAQLVNRGPLPGTEEEIDFAGSARALEADLRQAGFDVGPTGVREDAEPRLEIYARAGGLRWSGSFRGAEAPPAGERLMEEVLLQRLERGEAVAPYVPVGCVIELRPVGRTKDFWTL